MDPVFNDSELASKLFIDRSQLLRKLKSTVNMSPSEFIKKYRMDKPAELLKHENDNISEVAYAIGFKSLSYFSYSFKESFKMSPIAFITKQEEAQSDS